MCKSPSAGSPGLRTKLRAEIKRAIIIVSVVLGSQTQSRVIRETVVPENLDKSDMQRLL